MNTTLLQSLQLSSLQAQVRMLLFVFDHQDHRIDFDQNAYRPDALAMVKELIEKKLLVVQELLVSALALNGRIVLACTDLGKRLAIQMKDAAAKVDKPAANVNHP